DPEHLLCLNHIRENQPTMDMLQDYFHRRQFRGTLEQTVGHTLDFEKEELQAGFRADPASKCSIPILAKTGLVMRLARNLDKTRGFVNGAVAELNKQWFLPCCYGYATTIWKAQGASIDSGVLWFNNKRFAAVRGYAYVGVSRFRSKAGLFLFGKLRRSDFPPVDGQGGEEQ
ncbi:unnamed protein product, partial [Prorocentrum cordatum]